MATTRAPQRRQFGSVRKLPSGRYQARYVGPDRQQHTARDSGGRPLTFTSKAAASAYLARVSADVQREQWISPDAPRPDAPPTLAEWAAAWLAERDLAAVTRQHYQQLLRDWILPTFGDQQVTAIAPGAVRTWHAALGQRTGPTQRAHAYALLKSVLAQAVADEVLLANPCRLRGASSAKRATKTQLPTLAELAAIVEHTPARFRLMVHLAAWCGLRFGELAALRRCDIDLAAGVVRVRHGVTRTTGQVHVKEPKSDAGTRDVAIPPHLLPAVREHLAEHVPARRDALVFAAASGGYLAPSSTRRWYYAARLAAGRPDLRFHDLRHFAGTMAAVGGATLKELMSRLGHSTPAMAMRYQSAAADRDQVIAAALSELAAPVVPITSAKGKGARRSS